MTAFSIDVHTDLADRTFIEVDRRFNVVIERTETGIELRVYPRTADELWDFPFATFEIVESEIAVLESEIQSDSN
jgi:hypothetical protein